MYSSDGCGAPLAKDDVAVGEHRIFSMVTGPGDEDKSSRSAEREVVSEDEQQEFVDRSGRKAVGSKGKGVKRKKRETGDHRAGGRYVLSSTIERSEGGGGGSGNGRSAVSRKGWIEVGGTRSEKRKKIDGVVWRAKSYSFSAVERAVDGNRDESSKVSKFQVDFRDEKQPKFGEVKKRDADIPRGECEQREDSLERLKERANSHVLLEKSRSSMAQVTGRRDEEHKSNGSLIRRTIALEAPQSAHDERLEERQPTVRREHEKARLSKKTLKRSRDEEFKGSEEVKKRGDGSKRNTEELDREREREFKTQARERKHVQHGHFVPREEKRIARDRERGLRGGQVYTETVEQDRRRRGEHRRLGDNDRRLMKESKEGRHVHDGNELDVHGQEFRRDQQAGRNTHIRRAPGFFDSCLYRMGRRMRGGSSEHVPYARIERVSEGTGHGHTKSHSKHVRQFKKEERRLSRRRDSDTKDFRELDDVVTKGKSTQQIRGGKEERSTLCELAASRKCCQPDAVFNQETLEPGPREVRERDGLDIKCVNHDENSPITTRRIEVYTKRRCSSTVVVPILDSEEADVEDNPLKGGVVEESGDGGRLKAKSRTEDWKDDSKPTLESSIQVEKVVKTGETIETRSDAQGKEAAIEPQRETDEGDLRRKYDCTSLHQERLNLRQKKIRSNGVGASPSRNKSRAKSSRANERQTNGKYREAQGSHDAQGKADHKRYRESKQQARINKTDVLETTRTDHVKTRKSPEAHQLKPVKGGKEKKVNSKEYLLRRQMVKVDRVKDDDGSDLSSRETKRYKHKGMSHSESHTQHTRSLSPPKKENGKSTSPRRSEKDRAEWEKFEKERNSTLAAIDSRYRRFGGGTSGLGGYSPRRRRSEAAIKTPSPPSRSPERRKPRAWDLPPPGMNSSMVAAISAAHQVAAQQAAIHQAAAALASVAPLVSSSVLLSPGATSASASSGLTTIPSMIPSLLQQVNPAVTTVTLTQATRPLRRLYVGNVPATVSDGELLEFMNAAMLSANANHLAGTKPCINCSVNLEKSYAFAEFITPEDATAALAFDGVTLHGTTLKIRRPKDFAQPANGGAENASPILDMVSNSVADSPYKVFVGGISSSLSADKVKEIVTAFGQLKAYHWEVDNKKQPPQAFAFLEYMDPAATLKACAGMNGMRLGTGFLTVVLATPDASPKVTAQGEPFYGIPEHAKTLLEPPSRILELQNLVSEEEVQSMSEEEIEQTIEDIRLECARFGNVKSMHLVQPKASRGFERKRGMHVSTVEGNEEGMTPETVGMKALPQAVPENVPRQVVDDVLQTNGKDEFPNDRTDSFLGGVSADSCTASGSKVWDPQPPDRMVEVTEKKLCDMIVCPAMNTSPQSVEIEFSSRVMKDINGQRELSLGSGKTETLNLCGGNPLQDVVEEITGGVSSEFAKEESEVSTGDSEGLHVGKVYVEFSREESACQAAHSLHGRIFAGRQVIAGYLPLKIYQKKFHKGLGPQTYEERQELALAVQGHLTAHIKD